MDRDYKELLSTFNAHNVRYLIIGGYAYIHYAEVRTTKDLDVFVEPSPSNAVHVFKALAEFGAPLRGITVEDFATPGTIFQVGVEPQRVDVLTNIDGVPFSQAWETSEQGLVDDEIPVRYISAEALIVNKLASGRPRDLLDVHNLKKAAEARSRKPHSPKVG